MPRAKKPIRIERQIIRVIAPPPDPFRHALVGPAPGPGYTNHIGSTRDGAGNVFCAVTIDGPGADDLDVAIMKRTQGAHRRTRASRATG